MLRADVVVGAGERGFDVAQAGIDPLEWRPARGPLAGTGRHREVLAAGLLDRRPAGQAVADDIAPGSEVSSASRSTSFLRKPLTTLSRSRLGLRSAVVSTAATIGVLPAAPRPRLPPGRSPPR